MRQALLTLLAVAITLSFPWIGDAPTFGPGVTPPTVDNANLAVTMFTFFTLSLSNGEGFCGRRSPNAPQSSSLSFARRRAG